MDKLLDILKIRYEAVLQSDSDRSFYLNVHHYIDVIIKNPMFAEIMVEYEKEYTKKHAEIWYPYINDDAVADERERQTIKLERFNLYTGGYCSLLMRIYLPLEDYKNPDAELLDRYDPVVFLMLDGLGATIRMNLWDKDILKRYNRWYDGVRKDYENNLRQFHADFLTEVEKREIDDKEISPSPQPEKTIFSFNAHTGDFIFYEIKGNLSPASQDFKVLSTLYNAPDYQAPYLALIQSYNPSVEKASKVYRDNLSLIIRNLKKRFNILPVTKMSNKNIFLNSKKYGYRLNFSPASEKLE